MGNTPTSLKAKPEEPSHLPVQFSGPGKFQETPSAEDFDLLFEKWADEALQRVRFLAERPRQGNRIPAIVKRKVAHLCQMGICFPDSKPACFRMADSKGGAGGPYNRFTYAEKSKRIYPNYEYLVQIAGFRDLIVEYGYDPKWMKFEYHESLPPVYIAVDIGIQIPHGPKIFVEVKERKSQWESLVLELEVIGSRGVSLSAPDRGNDPLRKAKYIIVGHPDFFVGYSPEGFDPYRVIYERGNRFQLRPAAMPKAGGSTRTLTKPQRGSIEEGGEKINFVNGLLNFLQQGFEAPIKTFHFLESQKKCSRCAGRCQGLQPFFSSSNPWKDGLDPFLQWAQQWSPDTHKEWPIVAFFVNSLVGQFLMSRGLREECIGQIFRMEFTGRGRKERFVPPCLLRKNVEDTICIKKKFRGHDMCCDFLILPPFPALVAEVKLAVPGPTSRIFNTFRDDLIKCEEWMAEDSSSYIQERFGIARFDYALAILIDLSGRTDIQNIWKTAINEKDYQQRGVFPRLISPSMISSSPTILLPKNREATPSIPTALQHLKKKSFHSRKLSEKKANDPRINAARTQEHLKIALEAILQCEETREQQGVEVPLISWDDVHKFKAEVIQLIQKYNASAAKPIRYASPWAWRIESKGAPLTENGRKFGVELRCSFFPKGNKL